MKKFHYAWVIMIACAITQIGVLGTMVYPIGLFFGPITKELGVGIGQVALSQTILALVQAFFMPLAGKWLTQKNISHVMSLAALGMTGGFALLPFLPSIYIWYAIYVFMGFCASFICFLHTPILINIWFQKRSGLALGIATGAGAVGGALFTKLVGPALLTAFGWKLTMVGFAAIGAVLTIVPAMFMIRLKPSEKGVAPYGYDPEKSAQASEKVGLSYEAARKTKSFIFMLITLVGMACASVYASHLVEVAKKYGHEPSLGATMASLAMLGTLVTKLVVGPIKDKIGSYKALLGSTVFLLIVMLALAFAYQSPQVLSIASFLSGLGPTLCGFAAAWMTGMLFGSKDYAKILGRASMTYSVVLGVYTAVAGFIVDKTGTYQVSFIISAALTLVAFITIILAQAKKPAWD